ncbi:SDR family NAD(P)-dependent oxidoreductase [Streptomyces javensis]|uniref:SDR family NAD(P)-dependent oxidoreductase n=1 Tax=Streptomyces javensis TaxID=114698 RepID=UPI002811F192|nr:SDR family NAD(P)-dependent oxidoreductase [Streptomyces javensis]
MNGPESVVVSGTSEAVAALVEREPRARRIAVDYASHSPAVQDLREELLAALGPITPAVGTVPVHSSVTGGPIDGSTMDAEYWYTNLRQPVDFTGAVSALLAAGRQVFLEMSPHPVLTMSVERTAEAAGATIAVLGTLRRGEGGLGQFVRALGTAHVHGVPVDWSAVFPHATRVDLPTYAFQRSRFWPTDPVGTVDDTPQSEGPHDMLDLVRGHVAAVLGHRRAADVPADRAFSDLGLDSLTATQLRTALSDATGLDLPISLAFDHPTPAAVAAFLAGVTDAPVRRTVAADDGDPVVIVGMACRYPGGVADPEGLWRLVVDERDVVSAFPTDRGWDLDRLMLDSATTQGGFLHDAAGFDAEFFGISPREALAMDPQQRVLLETAWEAVERTGIDPSTLRSSATGVFVGASQQEYLGAADGENAELGGLVLTGKMSAVLSGRIAYTLDLKGPAVTVDTACSSSLVALHMAAQSVRSGESTLALAGGVAVMATPFAYEEFTHQGGLAADGRCKAFSAEADGTGWAEGAGLVVLERLSAATRNGHRVLAVLRGSAVNQDGASNGLSAPNGVAQQRVIRQALANARLRPRDVDMVEAHGTGTVLGDPIEANALIAAYGQDREQPLWLGSMKSNIGHAAAAAGIGGVIKTVSALAHRLMPRTLHVTEPAPTVDWPAGVRVLTETLAWPENDRPRRAGVSSFGVSGTNVHLILEQGPDRPDEASALDTGPTGVPWPLSGRTPEALRAQAARLAAHLRDRPGLRPVDVGLSLTTSRTALACRAVAFGPDDLDRIATQDQAMRIPGPRPVLVFPGQGAQWVGMAVELLASSPVFAERMEECAAALAPFVDWSLADVLGDEVALGRVDVVQPVLFAVMVSLARLWRSFGVEPAAVVGHSQGEIAAACVAGVLSLEDAARVVCVRSKLIARELAGHGGMVSLPLPLAEVEGLIAPFGDGLVVAAVNGPESVVVSGTSEAVAALVEREPRARRIAVDYASHSPAVQDLREELLKALAPITPGASTVPVYSSVTGGPIDGSTMDAEYWYTNLRQPVDFQGAVSALLADGFGAFVEPSPHPVLTTAVEQTAVDAEIAVVGTLRRQSGGMAQMLRAAAQACALGVDVDWSAAHPTGVRQVDLPTYPFAEERFWLDGGSARGEVSAVGLAPVDHALLGAKADMAASGEVVLSGSLSLASHPWLADHTVRGSVILPGAAFVELVVRAGDELGRPAVEELTLHTPLVIPADGRVDVQVTVATEGHVQIHSRTAGSDWTHHASAVVTDRPGEAPVWRSWPPEPAEAVDIERFYETLEDNGLDYGPAFRGVRAMWRSADAYYAEVALPDEVPETAFVLHPALLDSALQVMAFAAAEPGRTSLPFAWSGISVHASGARSLRVRVAATQAGDISVLATDPANAPVVTVDRVRSRTLGADQLDPPLAGLLSRLEWTPVEAGPPAVEPGPTVRYECEVADSPVEVANQVLEAVQEWLRHEGRPDSRLVVLTRGAVSTGPDDPVSALCQAPVWGLVRSAQAEHPGRLVIVDIDDGSDDALCAALATGEPQLALRRGVILAPRLVSARGDGDLPRIPSDGTVLVTGGTSGLGALVARHLAMRHGVRHLVLVSRSGPRADGAAELIAELGELGARAEAVACDVADRDQVRAVLEGIEEFPLAGVVHAAAVLDDGAITSLTPDRLRTVAAPKVHGALHLHELTEGMDLRLFALFSSAAGILGSPGQANYAAANAFLDALATQRQAAGLAGHSLAWGLWEQTTSLTAPVKATRRGATVGALSTAEGLALFDRALAGTDPVAVPVRMAPVARGPVRPAAAAVVAEPDFAARVAALGPAERGRELLKLVREQAAAILGFAGREEIDPRQPFLKSGFDSLTAVELRNRLNTITGLRLPATTTFDFPTPEALAGKLAAELASATSPEEALLAALDHLESVLAAPSTDEALRTALADRVAKLHARGNTEDRHSTARLRDAGADELFDFIHNELGMK